MSMRQSYVCAVKGAKLLDCNDGAFSKYEDAFNLESAILDKGPSLQKKNCSTTRT